MKYALDLSELIPLKAFYLGHLIRQKHSIQLTEAKKIVEEAIRKCDGSESYGTRKAFYLLLYCELSRESENSLSARVEAKEFCDGKGLEFLFQNYMLIVGGTISTKAIAGAGAFSEAVEEKISVEPSRTFMDEFGYWITTTPEPFDSLDVDYTKCSEKDLKFLFNISLQTLIDKHFGSS